MATVTANELAEELAPLDIERRLGRISLLPGRKIFTTSLGIEDQVVTAEIARVGADIAVATLDTGRLFKETVSLIAETEARYGLVIERHHPHPQDVADYVDRYGRDGFYENPEARHACCGVRKLTPLRQALKGAAFWITGVRRGQSGNRSGTPFCEHDPAHDLIKVNPLADLSIEEIRAYAERHQVPLNPLHARGYPSIGCEPCTRAIRPGEPERAGRWWWEQSQTRECGLHLTPSASDTSSPHLTVSRT